MLFTAGMGVGPFCWATAEPLTHYLWVAEYEDPRPLVCPLQLKGFSQINAFTKA